MKSSTKYVHNYNWACRCWYWSLITNENRSALIKLMFLSDWIHIPSSSMFKRSCWHSAFAVEKKSRCESTSHRGIVKYGCTWICLLFYFLSWAYRRFKNNCFSRHTCTCPVLICHELNKYSLIDCIASIMYMYLKQSCIKVIVKCYCYYSYLHSK